MSSKKKSAVKNTAWFIGVEFSPDGHLVDLEYSKTKSHLREFSTVLAVTVPVYTPPKAPQKEIKINV